MCWVVCKPMYFVRIKGNTETVQKMTFSIKDFFTKCDQIRKTADFVTFTEEILNGKLHFQCSENRS